MADELRTWFNPTFFRELGARLCAVYPAFDAEGFVAEVSHRLDDLSLMQRMTRTVEAMTPRLPQDFRAAVPLLKQVAPAYEGQFAGMFMAEFVATHGLHDRAYSLDALAYFTRFFSSEFAVRHFLLDDFATTIDVMIGWAGDSNHHVRRLASEGSRPRLPWSFNLPQLIADPAPVKPILDKLSGDPSPYVRKSVANHLNDISKDHPDLMLDWVTAWDRSDPGTAWIAKHAARSLIKKGHQQAFALFGFEAEPAVDVEDFAVTPDRVGIGQEVQLSFTLVSEAGHDQKLAVDYVIHFVKKAGKTSAKVFKLKELVLTPGERRPLQQRHSFIDRTIRTHHAGDHRFELLINGRIASVGTVQLDRV